MLNRAEEAFVTKISGDACRVLAAPIGLLVAARPGATPGDLELRWQADPAANGYNVWYVGAKEDIVLANQRNVPPAAPVGNCAVPSPATSTACTDIGGVGRGSPTTFFYQVRAYCDPGAEGP